MRAAQRSAVQRREAQYALTWPRTSALSRCCSRSAFEEDVVLEVVFWLMLLTFITSHLFQFHFADFEHYRHTSLLITLTFFSNKQIMQMSRLKALSRVVTNVTEAVM